MNCPWRLRKFNFKQYADQAPLSALQNNHEVSVRPKGVVEKCSFCIQRVNAVNKGVKLGEACRLETACSNACAFGAISVIDLRSENFPEGAEALLSDIGAKPRVAYVPRKETRE